MLESVATSLKGNGLVSNEDSECERLTVGGEV